MRINTTTDNLHTKGRRPAAKPNPARRKPRPHAGNPAPTTSRSTTEDRLSRHRGATGEAPEQPARCPDSVTIRELAEETGERLNTLLERLVDTYREQDEDPEPCGKP